MTWREILSNTNRITSSLGKIKYGLVSGTDFIWVSESPWAHGDLLWESNLVYSVKHCSKELSLFPLTLVSLKDVKRKALSTGIIEEWKILDK